MEKGKISPALRGMLADAHDPLVALRQSELDARIAAARKEERAQTLQEAECTIHEQQLAWRTGAYADDAAAEMARNCIETVRQLNTTPPAPTPEAATPAEEAGVWNALRATVHDNVNCLVTDSSLRGDAAMAESIIMNAARAYGDARAIAAAADAERRAADHKRTSDHVAELLGKCTDERRAARAASAVPVVVPKMVLTVVRMFLKDADAAIAHTSPGHEDYAAMVADRNAMRAWLRATAGAEGVRDA